MSLYAVQACTYALPLITFPYLGRVLGPEGWGAVLFAQAIGAAIAIAVEYGFDCSATREVARFWYDRDRLRELVAGVLGAKVALACAAVLVACCIQPFTLRIAPSLILFWASVVWGVAQGINMLWYFQGLQRMARAGGLDIGGKIIATLSIFLFVHAPNDGWKVMVAQALGCLVSHAVTVWMAYREVGFRWPTPQLAWESLRLGWPMFLFKASQTLTTSASGLILGFFGSPRAVGLFGGADKIRQVVSQSLWPVNQALFPHQAQSIVDDPEKGARIVRRSLLFMGGLSAIFGLVLMAGAPLIVELVFGKPFAAAVPALRIFGLAIPLATIASVLSFQWLLPLGFDREFNIVVLTSGLINVGAGILLVPAFGVTGMAIAIVIAGFYAIIGFDIAARRKGMSVLGRLRISKQVAQVEYQEVEAEEVLQR
jgi:polysaccharide transporter, PST family